MKRSKPPVENRLGVSIPKAAQPQQKKSPDSQTSACRIITGATGGIGGAVAPDLAADGYVTHKNR